MANQIFHFSNTGISSGQRFHLKDEVSGIFVRNLNIDSNFPIVASNLVYNTGNQTISGEKTFAGTGIFNAVDLNNIDNLSLSGIDIDITGSTVNVYGNVLISGNPVLTGDRNISTLNLNNIVYTTGNQTISGVKTFALRPTVNGTGVLLSGEAAGLPTTIVYTTGNQTINGNKTFTGVTTFSGQEVNLVDVGLNLSGVGDMTFSGTNINFINSPVYISGTNLRVDGNILANNLVHNTGNQTINGLKTFTSGIDIYSGTNPQSIRVFNRTGTNSGEFGLFGWQNNNLIVGPQQTNSGILRDLTLTGANININASGALNIFDNTNIVGNLDVSGMIRTPQQNKKFVYAPNVIGGGNLTTTIAYGANCTLTPRFVGTLRADASISMTALNVLSSDTAQSASFWYGTGTPPTYSGNLVALNGNRIGGIKGFHATSFPGQSTLFPVSASWVSEITGLTTGTLYWFDIGFSGSKIRVQDVQIYIEEKY